MNTIPYDNDNDLSKHVRKELNRIIKENKFPLRTHVLRENYAAIIKLAVSFGDMKTDSNVSTTSVLLGYDLISLLQSKTLKP